MNDFVMEILKVIVMLAVILVTRYLVPWIRAKIGAEQLEEVKTWVNAAVLMAQQVYDAKPGAERKAIVVDMIRKMLTKKNIDISAEQLDTLIEAAVKAMKMQGSPNVKVTAFGA
ncbi:MAG: phage holin [Lachnospiraceae bacterium]|nr:phage holin [Lachnospiraceae bacterium]